jgi:predicted dehydrogenase
MATTMLRIGIAGCGLAARAHLDQLRAIDGVRVVGLADPDLAAAEALAAQVPLDESGTAAAAFADHRDLLREATPDALAVFTPHREHYRPVMDALQAGCHVFVEKPLSTNVQEAADIVGLAKGRDRKVGVGHQYRLLPSLIEARRRLDSGAIGTIRLVTASLARPWLASQSEGGGEGSWRFDPKVAGGGILTDAGDHLLDALLWTTGQAAVEVAAFQDRLESGLDLVTAAAVRLADGVPATVALSGVSADELFEMTYFGDRGRLRVTDRALGEESDDAISWAPPAPEAAEGIVANFAAAILAGAPLCCPADQALDTVRLVEAITRSASTGQVVRLA